VLQEENMETQPSLAPGQNGTKKLVAKYGDRLIRRYLIALVHDLQIVIVRCYRQLTKTYGWAYDKWWHVGRLEPGRTPAAEPGAAADAPQAASP
jgi:hypothetical protein